MIPLVAILVLAAWLTGSPSIALADEPSCTGFPPDSLSRAECERNLKASKVGKPDQSAVMTMPAPGTPAPRPQSQRGGSQPPPTNLNVRYEGPIRIRHLSGNEILVDKAWVQGDQLVYLRKGASGSVRLVDVDVIVDQDLEVASGQCRDQFEHSGSAWVVERARKQSLEENPWDATLINRIFDEMKEERWRQFLRTCSDYQIKRSERARVFEEARDRARHR